MDNLPPPDTEESRKEPLRFEFSYFPIFVDLLLRFAVLALWRKSLLPEWLFWVIQIAVISFVITAWTYNRLEKIKLRYGVTGKFEPQFQAHSVIASFVLAFHGAYQIYIDLGGIRTLYIHVTISIILTLAYLFYLLMIYMGSVTSHPKTDALESTIPIYDAIDENDRQLIRLQTVIAVFERRVESYTIESTLIGGLTFSAFVTIISSDHVSTSGIGDLLLRTSNILGSISTLRLDLHKSYDAITQPLSGSTILELVACLALLCALLFVAVIVARLRFNSLVGVANYSTLMAAAFNEKEEGIDQIMISNLLTEQESLKKRLGVLQVHISTSLDEANVAVDQLRPIVSYMGVFRHMGVLTFLGTLVASAMWFSPWLALGFSAVGILAYGYPTIDHLLRDKRIRRLTFFLMPNVLKRK